MGFFFLQIIYATLQTMHITDKETKKCKVIQHPQEQNVANTHYQQG